jgi:hypothetical protein
MKLHPAHDPDCPLDCPQNHNGMLRLLAYYDNETGYATRMVEV